MTAASVYDSGGLCYICREQCGTAHACGCRHHRGPVLDATGAFYRATAPDGTILTKRSRHHSPVCAVLVLGRHGWAVWSSHSSDQAAQAAIERIDVPYAAVTVVPAEVLPHS